MTSLLVAGCASPGQRTIPAGFEGNSPASLADALLAADLAFSAASDSTSLVAGISAMLADDVIMPLPGGRFAEGKQAIQDALSANPDNLTSKASWIPIRSGISADGLQGFTYGFTMTEKVDGTSAPGKYLSYWVKSGGRWMVAAYKRAPAGDGLLSTLPPSLPPATVSPMSDPARLDAIKLSLMNAERDFSRDAQTMGLGPAFVMYGSPDAMNMGSGPTFVIGPEEIAKAVSGNTPPGRSPVSWEPERAIVASSGDLGVTIGIITSNQPPAAGATSPRYAFFTIWRRASPDAPWRYVAE